MQTVFFVMVALSVLIGCGGVEPSRELEQQSMVEDGDEDGVPTADDRCPAEPEDRDGFDDSDGCPDPDNDHDGVADGADQCPCIREDRDSHEDGDGCPDLDNDGDNVPDPCDACPNEAGVSDDGCPAHEAGSGNTEPAPCPQDALEAMQQDVCAG